MIEKLKPIQIGEYYDLDLTDKINELIEEINRIKKLIEPTSH
jgi:hypothetical protein